MRLPQSMRGVDRGLHFFISERLFAGDILAGAGGPVHLDHVRARADLLAYDFHHFGGTVGGSGSAAPAAARD